MTADTPLAHAVRQLATGQPLGETLTAEAFGQIMRGEATPALTAALLMGLRVRGETVAEISGAVRALRAAMVPISVRDSVQLIDTCGTGGGRVPTFNISTAAAFVAVGAGAAVAKHGNRSFTSQCGSADVIEALGIGMSRDPGHAARLLETVRLGFLFAPAFHPAMRHAAPVRRELGVATIMNIVGPLANPAGVRRQLIGVADRSLGPPVAGVLARLGAEHALVVHGAVGMDEIAPHGLTDAWEVSGGAVRSLTIDPATYGMAHADLTALAGGTPSENAVRVERLLSDPAGDAAGRAAVVLNAGAACWVAGLSDTLAAGMELARAALEEGQAAAVLERLRAAAPAGSKE